MELPPDPSRDKGFFTEGTDGVSGRKRKASLIDVDNAKAQLFVERKARLQAEAAAERFRAETKAALRQARWREEIQVNSDAGRAVQAETAESARAGITGLANVDEPTKIRDAVAEVGAHQC